MIGYYSHKCHSSDYIWPYRYWLPNTADFIMFSGRNEDVKLISRCVLFYRENSSFPCEGAAVPAWYPGAWSSDHASFWRSDYPAIHVLSVADYPPYHKPGDTPDKLDFADTARVTAGLARLVEYLADAPHENSR
jgi:hypothetical protein